MLNVKKAILIVFIGLAIASAMAQRRLLNGRTESRPQLLEPLLPFPEAVEKAKAGNPQGWYALAIHYAKGEAIERNAETARQFLRKANDMNYSNAVFVTTMLMEKKCKPEELSGIRKYNMYDRCVPLSEYTGVGQLMVAYNMSLTNAIDVAKIRAGYERAINLGVLVATNELARFERRVEAAQAQVRKDADTARRKAENAKLAEGLL